MSVARTRDVPAELLVALRACPWIADSDEAALVELAGLAQCHAYPKSNVLFYEGDMTHAAYLVVSGKVKVCLMNEEAKEVVVTIVRPGGVVGLVAMLDGGGQPASAITITRSKLARFDVTELRGWIDRRPEVQRRLVTALASGVREGFRKIGEHALLSVRERLLFTLLEIAELEGEPPTEGDGVVFIRPTHQELADRIGSSREVVSRVLKDLLDSELLSAEEGKVIRVSHAALVLR